MSGIDWTFLTGFGGFIAVVLIIAIRAGMIMKNYSKSAKETLKEQVTLPVEDLKIGVDKSISTLSRHVDDLSNQLSEFTRREKNDHQSLINIMKKSDHSHKEILTMMKRLDHDHQEIKLHHRKLVAQKKELVKHKKDIKWLEQNKADKKKRGNQK